MNKKILAAVTLALDECAPHIQEVALIQGKSNYISISIKEVNVKHGLTQKQKNCLNTMVTLSQPHLLDKINGYAGSKIIGVISNISKFYRLTKNDWYLHFDYELKTKKKTTSIDLVILNEDEYTEMRDKDSLVALSEGVIEINNEPNQTADIYDED